MRAVDNSGNPVVGKLKGADTSTSARRMQSAQDFLALLQRRGAGQLNVRPSQSGPEAIQTPTKVAMPSLAAATTSSPRTGPFAVNPGASALLDQQEAHLAALMDPVNDFNLVLSLNNMPMANNVAWYENNSLTYPTGLNWREMMDSRSRVLSTAHNQVALAGRLTPEIDAKYREAMGEIEQFRRDRQAGIEPPVPRQFHRLLRSEVPLTRDQVRERVTEYLKSPLLNDGTARRVADLELQRRGFYRS